MKKYQVRLIKRNLYRHGNAITYCLIFAIATIITIAAASGRADNVAYVDESQLITSVDSVDIKDSETQKVAANETTSVDDATDETITSNEDTSVDDTTSEDLSNNDTSSNSTSKIKVTADSLNVRKAPSADAEPMGEVVMDEIYTVLGYEGQWVKIQFGNEVGYINAAYVHVVE